MKSIRVYDVPSGLGGKFTVSIIEKIDSVKTRVRVWCGRPTHRGWESWADFDGMQMVVDQSALHNSRLMNLYTIH